MSGTAHIREILPVDDEHQVVSVEGRPRGYRRTPCGGCPWRVNQTGAFPADAFVQSARTAYDLSAHGFGCHESGTARPATCAGFLLRGSEHNLAARIRRADGSIDMAQVHDGGHDLHPGYRSMAEANGVPADHPVLDRCRASSEERRRWTE